MVLVQEHTPYFNFTVEAKKDELTRILSSHYTVEVLEEETDDPTTIRAIYMYHLYLEQAENLIYRINISDPLPEFIVFREHVPQELITELEGLPEVLMDEIVTDAVRRIFESVDFKLSKVHARCSFCPPGRFHQVIIKKNHAKI